MSMKELIESDKFEEAMQAISDGANINAGDRAGATILMRAIVRKRQDVVIWLLEKGAEINQQDKSGWSALHFASSEKNLEAVKVLLGRGANANLQDKHGNTAIVVCLSQRYGEFVEIAKLLLEHGADPAIKNNYGIAPLDVFTDVLGPLLAKN